MAPNVFKQNANSTSDCPWIVVDATPNSGEAVESGEFISDQLQPDDIFNPFLLDSGFETSLDDFFLSCDTPEERLTRALDKYKSVNSTKSHHVVAQLWVPIPTQGDFLLRHSCQYAFGPLVNNDQMKKKVSKRYVVDSLRKVFPIGLNSAQSLGIGDDEDIPVLSNLDKGSILINRWVSYKAFQLQCVQWAPNVHIYSSNSQHYCICQTLALPVFDTALNKLVGVFELVIDCDDIDYVAEIQEICNHLQEVRLVGADIKFFNQPRQMVLLEIMNLLRNASRILNIPLAQTWLPCKCCGGGDQNSQTMKICMRSAEIPFILMDSSLFEFWKDSSMHYMYEGQGVAGRAFQSKGSCFCNDITQFSDQDFPFVETSRKFGVCSSLAICLKSSSTGDDIYIVQFFIRDSLTSVRKQKDFVVSIVKSIAHNSGSLKFASTELEEIDPKLGNTTMRKWVSNIRMVEEQKSVVSSSKTSEEMVDKGKGRMVELNGNKDVQYKKVRKKKTQNVVLCKDDLIPFLYGTKEEAAIALGVSKSTVKRLPKEYGYDNWRHAQICNGIPPTKRRSK